MKIMDDFHLELKPSRAYHKIDTFVGSKNEWEKDPGKSMKNVLYYMHSSMAKGTSWAEAMLNCEKIKPAALAIVELWESEGISQAGS